ncbi:MAG: FRG domain-containing protein [Flavobacteriaceae bacterium]
MIETIDLTWEDYVEETKNLTNSDFIFRGQANSFENNKFVKWGITSSFNRMNSTSKFKRFLSQQLEQGLFDVYYREYEFVKKNSLDKSDLISRLYFLQHYNIPTCLVDFTFDPLVALYFSFCSLKQYKSMPINCGPRGHSRYYNEEWGVSVFQINHKLLQETLKIKKLANRDLIINYENYAIDLEKGVKWANLALDLKPLSKINKSIDNYNLENQKGCFLLYDNYYAKDYDLISFIEEFCEINEISFNEPLVKIYNIKYNSFFNRSSLKKIKNKTGFKYLKEKGRTGEKLFNDFQGIKYDFNFFYD